MNNNLMELDKLLHESNNELESKNKVRRETDMIFILNLYNQMKLIRNSHKILT